MTSWRITLQLTAFCRGIQQQFATRQDDPCLGRRRSSSHGSSLLCLADLLLLRLYRFISL